MRFLDGILFLPLITLAACSPAAGSTPDVTNDLHCSVVTYYFSDFAERSGAPADQKRATAAVTEWYALKMRERAAQQGGSDTLMSEAARILEVVKADPVGMADEMTACTERAVSDPAFDGFVSALR